LCSRSETFAGSYCCRRHATEFEVRKGESVVLACRSNLDASNILPYLVIWNDGVLLHAALRFCGYDGLWAFISFRTFLCSRFLAQSQACKVAVLVDECWSSRFDSVIFRACAVQFELGRFGYRFDIGASCCIIHARLQLMADDAWLEGFTR
jgi:hypothetical protein